MLGSKEVVWLRGSSGHSRGWKQGNYASTAEGLIYSISWPEVHSSFEASFTQVLGANYVYGFLQDVLSNFQVLPAFSGIDGIGMAY